MLELFCDGSFKDAFAAFCASAHRDVLEAVQTAAEFQIHRQAPLDDLSTAKATFAIRRFHLQSSKSINTVKINSPVLSQNRHTAVSDRLSSAGPRTVYRRSARIVRIL